MDLIWNPSREKRHPGLYKGTPAFWKKCSEKVALLKQLGLGGSDGTAGRPTPTIVCPLRKSVFFLSQPLPKSPTQQAKQPTWNPALGTAKSSLFSPPSTPTHPREDSSEAEVTSLSPQQKGQLLPYPDALFVPQFFHHYPPPSLLNCEPLGRSQSR